MNQIVISVEPNCQHIRPEECGRYTCLTFLNGERYVYCAHTDSIYEKLQYLVKQKTGEIIDLSAFEFKLVPFIQVQRCYLRSGEAKYEVIGDDAVYLREDVYTWFGDGMHLINLEEAVLYDMFVEDRRLREERMKKRQSEQAPALMK